jgi:hypothetical protein
MILDRLARFRALFDAHSRLAAGREAGAQLAPVMETLGEAAAELPPLASRFRLLRQVGVVTEPAPDAAALLRLVASLRERLAAAGEGGATVPKQTIGRFRNLAEVLRDALREQVARAWAEWVGARIPFLSDDDLRLAEQDQRFVAVAAEVRARGYDVRRLADQPPDTVEAFAAAWNELHALSKAVARLPDVSADAEVAGFLRAVAEGVATLTHVTPRVLDWLRQRERAAGFAVVRGTAARPGDSDGEAAPA